VAIRVRGRVKINLRSKIEKNVDIFLILCLKPLQVQKAISITEVGKFADHVAGNCEAHVNLGDVAKIPAVKKGGEIY